MKGDVFMKCRVIEIIMVVSLVIKSIVVIGGDLVLVWSVFLLEVHNRLINHLPEHFSFYVSPGDALQLQKNFEILLNVRAQLHKSSLLKPHTLLIIIITLSLCGTLLGWKNMVLCSQLPESSSDIKGASESSSGWGGWGGDCVPVVMFTMIKT